ncbi:ABC transporter substrate-binding protein [Pseudonocardia sp. GCM10023141]|uniref:ABC transporter substrate-binding protein n=1 Tax=Pseudonocardia sp. GCM10023141 TaxID=3252653 RepID=UPI00361DC3EC
MTRSRSHIAVVALAVVALAMTSACAQRGAAPAAAGTSGACADAQGVTDTTIRIGSTWPLTGAAAVGAAGSKAGVVAAIGEINAAGGINGRKLELVSYDDAFEAARSVANIRRLVDNDKVFAILGPSGSANLPGSYSYLQSKNIPLFGPVLPPDPNLPNVYLLSTSHTDQIRVLVDHLAASGVRKVALIGQDNDLGHAVEKGITEQAALDGVTLVAKETLDPNSPDVSSAVLNARAAGPDALISGGDNAQTALILKQVHQLGWNVPVGGDSTSGAPGSTNTVAPAGPAADGFTATGVSEFPTSTDPAVTKYRAAMATYAPDQATNSYALINYATSQVFFQVLRQMGHDVCQSGFQAAAEKISDVATGLIPPVTFGPLPGGHTGTKGAKVAQFRGGAWSFLDNDFVQPKSG